MTRSIKDHNGGTKQLANPYVFPCLHPGLRNLPPTYISVCGLDPVRDDGTVLKYNLDKFGYVECST
jgi:versiconal hemiacetal acetate esterase